MTNNDLAVNEVVSVCACVDKSCEAMVGYDGIRAVYLGSTLSVCETPDVYTLGLN